YKKSAIRNPRSSILDPRSSILDPRSCIIRFPVRHQSTFNIKGDSMASISFKGNLVNLAGAEVKAGQDAPDFKLQKIDMSDYTLASGAGKTGISAAVPSLDRRVANASTRRRSKETR